MGFKSDLEIEMSSAYASNNDFNRVSNLCKTNPRRECPELVSERLLTYANTTKVIGGLALATASYFIGKEIADTVANYSNAMDNLMGGTSSVLSYFVFRNALFRAGLDLGIRNASKN